MSAEAIKEARKLYSSPMFSAQPFAPMTIPGIT